MSPPLKVTSLKKLWDITAIEDVKKERVKEVIRITTTQKNDIIHKGSYTVVTSGKKTIHMDHKKIQAA